jgi:hypothetical protein
MGTDDKSPYLNEVEAAKFLRITAKTLRNMRWRDEGPTYRKHGSRVLYHIRDLRNWSSANALGCERSPVPTGA